MASVLSITGIIFLIFGSADVQPWAMPPPGQSVVDTTVQPDNIPTKTSFADLTELSTQEKPKLAIDEAENTATTRL
jgi:hypothetical protein